MASTTLPAHNAAASDIDYIEHVNPQWVRLLNLLILNLKYTQCQGSELTTADGRRIVDFLSGYCVHNSGHNHPYIVEELQRELERLGPVMLQSMCRTSPVNWRSVCAAWLVAR